MMSPVDVSVEIEIGAAPADVAAVMFDPQREPQWMSAIKDVELIDAALAPGARVRRRASVMGHDVGWTTEVERVMFPHLLVLRVTEGPFTGTIKYEIQRSAAGSHVTIHNTGQSAGLSFIPAAMIAAPLKTALNADLGRLKNLVESGTKG
jgi:uncharacterized protein YndB with AHSA1/START domain